MTLPAAEVVPGVYRFTDARANWYAVQAEHGLVLVDCGWPRSRPALLAGLSAIGRTLADVAGVVLTHGHPDHLGSAAWLADAHGVNVYAREDELPRVRGERAATRAPSLALALWRPTALRFVAGSIQRGVLSPRWPAAPAALPSPLPGGLVPVPTPGHTEGHTAYHLPERGVLFSGDALVTYDVLTGQRGPRLHPAAFTVDVTRARDSLGALEGLAANVVLPGHGEPYWDGVASAVALARSGVAGEDTLGAASGAAR